jgi:glycosyltransferase involved in cell wall biosynthesis
VPQAGLNICLLTSSFPHTPEDRIAAPFLPPFIRAMQAQGVRLTVYTQDRPGPHEPVVDVPICWFPWSHSQEALSQLKPYVPAHLMHISRLIRNGRRYVVPFLHQHRIDLCLAAWTIPSGYFAYHAKKILGTPYCVWALGSDIYTWAKYPGLRQLMRHILQHADGLFADGWDLAHRVQCLAARPCTFLPSVRPLAEDMPAVKTHVDATKTNFLFIGRWERVKGVDVLIEAMKLLKDAHVAAHLYILGKGSLKGFLERKIRAYSLSEAVFLKEDVPTAILRGYLQQCDCLLIPSRRDSIPLVFSEGLQACIPFIVAATGDLGSLVQRFALGHVVPPGDSTQLKHAMQAFIDNRHQKTQYLRHVDEAKALFDIDKVTTAFLQHASQVVSRQAVDESLKPAAVSR